MVTRFFFILSLLYLLHLPMNLLEAAPAFDASIDSMNSQAHFPLEGTITITHKKEENIDPHSFEMDGKRLDVSLVKDVPMSASGDTWVAIYNFQLPGQDQGRHLLPSITLKIGNQVFRTAPSPYEVNGEGPPLSTPSSSSAASPLIFRLEASIKGPSTLFPGERTILFYRIIYNRSVDLTRSELPMIHPPHFQKVGDVQIRDYQEQNRTVQELSQEVQASDFGTFELGPSLIEGYAYTMNGDQKVYDRTLLQAKALPVKIEVKPFPITNQPITFTGALGSIKGSAGLESSSKVAVGETVQVQVKIEGVAILSDLRLPSLECQPGFSGFFQTSDLPPPAEVKGESKIFHVELRPLTSLIDQIPSIALSSFDPSTGKYITQKTDPIPITVNANPLKKPSVSSVAIIAKLPPLPAATQWPAPVLSPLELQGGAIQLGQSKISWIKGPAVFWMLPIGILLLFLQYKWRQFEEQRPKPQIPTSEKLFRHGTKTENLQLLEEAFWHRLWEKQQVPPHIFQLEKLSQMENLAPIYSFLFKLQSLQYSENKNFDFSQLKSQAKQLFEKI